MRIRQEAVFNSGVIEEKCFSPIASPCQKVGKSRSCVSSKRVYDASHSVPISNTEDDDEKVRRNTKQDYKYGLVDAILTENITDSESEDSTFEALSITNGAQIDFTTTTQMTTGKFHSCSLAIQQGEQNVIEASTLTDAPLSVSSYHEYSFRSKGLTIEELNG